VDLTIAQSTPEQTMPREHEDRRRSVRLVSIALRNLIRRPEHTVLAVVGIALTITVAVAVESISTGYQVRGGDAYDRAVGDASAWIVPSGGITYSPQFGSLLPRGQLPAAPDFGGGWKFVATIAGTTDVEGRPVAIFGSAQNPAGVATVSEPAAKSMGLSTGSAVEVAGARLRVLVKGSQGRYALVPLAVARAAVGDRGWLTVFPPAAAADVRDRLAAATGLPVTADPTVTAARNRGLVYITRGGGGVFTFRDRFSSVLAGRVQGSVLGVIADLALVLGFVIAVTSFLAAVQERRREFGVMASIGLTDEVLYFFLTEALLTFLAAYVLGILLAGVALLIVSPGQLSLSDVLEAAALVLTYLPALGIFAALIPAHRITQQRPVDLLRDESG
jgi:putative ABC transport system permease protein